WRPRGVVLIVAEAVYTITDPPLRALRRLIPPLTLGSIRLDLAFMVLVFLCWLLLTLLGAVTLL
ncbi:MAG TPA: YggT family protein, partial [Propionibacteriaceae bacterium]